MRPKGRIAIALLTIIVLLGSLGWAARKPSPQQSTPMATADSPAEAWLTPVEQDPAGLAPTGRLTLTTAKPLTTAMVRASLTVQPAMDVQVEPADNEGKRFTVAPARALEPDQVYRFRLAQEAGLARTHQWSFQTRSEFRLLGTLPAHQGTGVPVNTGIEFTFSHADYGDLGAYFSISPAVKGRFERHKGTAVFVPAEELEPSTVYTVTLRQGLGRTEGEGRLSTDRIFSFETADPSASSDRSTFHLSSDMAEFSTENAPFFGIWSWNGQSSPYEITAFRYANVDAFIDALQKADALPWWATAARNRNREATDGLTEVVTITATLQSHETGTYLLFPEPLPAGYYLANIKLKEEERQVRFQVTDLSYYVAETTTGSLVWLNDLTLGGPAVGATVTLPDGSQKVITDSDGVAVLNPTGTDEAAEQRPPLSLIARAGEKEALLFSPAQRYWGYTAADGPELYWKYLYLDRSLYKPSDMLHFWGILHPREAEAAPLDEVRVTIQRSDYWRFDGGPVSLVEATLPVQNSTFTGSLSLPNLTPGYYEAQLSVRGERFASQWFEVATFSKPAYRLEITADKDVAFTGEPITFRIKAFFFEGTPVPNMKLNPYFNWGYSQYSALVTDENGEAVLTFTPPHQQAETWGYDDYLYFSVSAAEPEVGEVSADHRVRLITRDAVVKPQVTQADGAATVSVQLNQFTLEQLTNDQIQGPAIPGRAVQFTLMEQNWTRFDEGQVYDFIEKVFYPRYRYVEAHRIIGTETVVTDAAGQAGFTFAVDPEKRYEVRFRVQDSRGLWITQSRFISGRQFIYPEPREWGWVHLASEDPDRYQASLDEPTGFSLNKGQSRLMDRPQSFLFFTARRGLQSYGVQGSGTYWLTMTERDLPVISLTGVHFDGRRYVHAERSIRLDKEERRLTVKVTPDKESYRPGDEVHLQVEVVDRQGRPAVGAVVNLNLVDEALFAVREQWVDTLGTLYGDWVSSGILRSRSSHYLPQFGGGAEKGGEGGGVRTDFRDAALFTSLVTDGAGRTKASFRVPDNLTSWRLTYQAVRPATMEAGNGSLGIPVRLPFFVDLVMGERFLVGERPVVQVRAYGTALTGSEQVRFRVEVEGPPGSIQIPVQVEVSGSPFAPHSVPFPVLQAEGPYRVRVSASAEGGLTDALEQSILVHSTYLRQNKVDFTLLQPGIQLQGAKDGLTSLTFLDWERGRYLDLLHRMRWHWGNRFEMKLARAVATDLLKAHFGWAEEWPEPELETFRYQNGDGSIAILPYSDGNLKLSVLAADLALERFDQVTLGLYFRRILDDDGETRERQILALYGLAALNQPVLVSAQALLAEANLSPFEQLYLMLALAELGDLEAVRPAYRKIIEQYSEQIGRELRLNFALDSDARLEATALMAALAGKLSAPETPGLLSYLAQNQPKESLILLEQLLAAQSGLAGLSGEPVSFTYRLGGEEVKKALKPGERFQIAPRPEQMASLRITAVEGSVAAVAAYSIAGKPVVERSGGLVERSYAPAREKWKPGDIVVVTLRYILAAETPEGGYELTDTLPSGLRYLERPWQYGLRVGWSAFDSWSLQVDGQRVTFWAGKQGRPIFYRARVVTAGEYRAEEPVLQHQQSGLIYGMGSSEAVRIGW